MWCCRPLRARMPGASGVQANSGGRVGNRGCPIYRSASCTSRDTMSKNQSIRVKMAGAAPSVWAETMEYFFVRRWLDCSRWCEVRLRAALIRHACTARATSSSTVKRLATSAPSTRRTTRSVGIPGQRQRRLPAVSMGSKRYGGCREKRRTASAWKFGDRASLPANLAYRACWRWS